MNDLLAGIAARCCARLSRPIIGESGVAGETELGRPKSCVPAMSNCIHPMQAALPREKRPFEKLWGCEIELQDVSDAVPEMRIW